MTDSTDTVETTLYYTHFNSKNPRLTEDEKTRIREVREILVNKFSMVDVGEGGYVFASELNESGANFEILHTLQGLDTNTSGFVWFQPMDFVKEQRWLEGDLLERVNRAREVFANRQRVYEDLAKFSV